MAFGFPAERKPQRHTIEISGQLEFSFLPFWPERNDITLVQIEQLREPLLNVQRKVMVETDETNVDALIRPVRSTDAHAWERLRCELWPDGREDHAPEIARFYAGTLPEVAEVLVAETFEGKMIGFAELSIRTDLPTLVGTRVGYVEGLYVIAEARGSGITRELLRASS